jgi:ABC-type xylose transport system permease subunit
LRRPLSSPLHRADLTAATRRGVYSGRSFSISRSALIAAAVVGGTPLTGGVGSIQGTILGALIITILSNGMNIMGLDPYFRNIVKGLVLTLSVFITIDRKKIGVIK